MPWYYAGLEGKPVGPVSLEELQSRRRVGVLAPETYVIEHTGRQGEPLAWRRYRDLFPESLSAPPTPGQPVPATLPPVPVHPLFPSAASAHTQPPVYPSTYVPHHYPASKPLNGLCLWGCILGAAAVPFSFLCIGLLPAVLGLFLSLFGLIQVNRNASQSGRGFAIGGLVLSLLAILIALIIAAVFVAPKIQATESTIMGQTTNDSD